MFISASFGENRHMQYIRRKKNQILTLKSENSKLKTGKSMLHFISVQQVHLAHSRADKILIHHPAIQLVSKLKIQLGNFFG